MSITVFTNRHNNNLNILPETCFSFDAGKNFNIKNASKRQLMVVEAADADSGGSELSNGTKEENVELKKEVKF